MRTCTYSEVEQGGIYLINKRYVVIALLPGHNYNTGEQWWKIHTLMGAGSTSYLYDNDTIEELSYEELSLYLGTFDYESPVLEPILKQGRSVLNEQGRFRLKVTEEGKMWDILEETANGMAQEER